jgi:hypothetical protein
MGKMAKGIHFTGTIGNISYYEIDGQTYVRIKSSLTRERVLKDKKFEKTRKYAGDLGRASRIGSAVYRALPADIKGRWIFRAITGEAASLLYEGKSEQEVRNILWKKYIQDTDCRNETTDSAPINYTVRPLPSTKKSNRRFQLIFLRLWEKQGKPARYFKRAWQRGQRFTPETIPRRSEYFLGMKQATGVMSV